MKKMQLSVLALMVCAVLSVQAKTPMSPESVVAWNEKMMNVLKTLQDEFKDMKKRVSDEVFREAYDEIADELEELRDELKKLRVPRTKVKYKVEWPKKWRWFADDDQKVVVKQRPKKQKYTYYVPLTSDQYDNLSRGDENLFAEGSIIAS